MNKEAGAVTTYGEKIRSFDWSTDSKRIAAIPAEQPSLPVVVLLDPTSGEAIETIPIAEDGKLQKLAWQRSPNLLVVTERDLGKAAPAETASIVCSIDPCTKRREVLATGPMWVRDARWLPDAGGCLFFGRSFARLRRLFVLSKGAAGPRPIAMDGVVSWRSFLPDGKSMIVMEESSAVSRLMRVALDGTGPVVEIAANRPASISGIEHKRVEVVTSEGEKVALLVSHNTDAKRHANAVFIRAHGGLVQWGEERWAETQLYLEHGVDVIQVERRVSDAKQAGDLIAALDYARTTLGVPRERIVVLAASTPAAAVVRAAQLHPEKVGVIGIIGLYKEPSLPPSLSQAAASLRVLGFHGEQDRTIPPEVAQNFIEKAFGEDALRPPRGLWHVFAGEPHTLARDESHAAIHATILHLLGLAGAERS